MIPLATALLAAFTEACKAYVARLAWEQSTHKETTANTLEDEKIRLGELGTPAAKLQLEAIGRRIDRNNQS